MPHWTFQASAPFSNDASLHGNIKRVKAKNLRSALKQLPKPSTFGRKWVLVRADGSDK